MLFFMSYRSLVGKHIYVCAHMSDSSPYYSLLSFVHNGHNILLKNNYNNNISSFSQVDHKLKIVVPCQYFFGGRLVMHNFFD